MMKLIVIGALWSLIGNFSRKKRKERDTVTVSAASYDHKSILVAAAETPPALQS